MLKRKENILVPKEVCKSPVIEDALRAWQEIHQEAKRNGTSEMTLEEINAEIAEARRQSTEKALQALDEMNRISKLNGNSEMTLEEINAEIYAARREMEMFAARRAQ